MSRSPSPPPNPLPSPQPLRSPSIPQSAPQTPDVTLRRHGSIVSSTFVPSSASLDGSFKHHRDGAASTPNTPRFISEMDQGDEEALLDPGRRSRRPSMMHYEQMDSWMRLAKIGVTKFVLTLSLAAILYLCLRSWEGFYDSVPLSKKDVQIFNALTIAISICIGLNLLGSLKKYAVFLRWAILTRYWVPVEIFDLILGIDELTNVAKLFVLSTPALQYKWLLGRSPPWRNPHGGYRQKFATVCLIWLLINIGSQVLVASLSLFWPMEPYKCPLTKYGSVAVADLSKWDDAETASRVHSSREAAWRYGLEAQSWSNFSNADKPPDLSQLPGTPIYKDDDSFEYRFYYRNPNRLYSDYLVSNRSIKTEAICIPYQVQTVVYETKTQWPDSYFAIANLQDEGTISVPIPFMGQGMVTWQAIINDTCGARCTQIIVFQKNGTGTETAKNIDKDSLWKCDSTVHNISTTRAGASHAGISTTDTAIYGTDVFAKLAAGAIGWTGISEGGWKDRQWRMYTQDSPWSPKHVLSTDEVQEMIMRFSIGAIAAFDDHGTRHNITIDDRTCDEHSQKLKVTWKYIWIILGAIAGIQFIALCYLLIRANRSIVRDSSYFSVAVLLRPILEVIDDVPGRMAMTGTEIKAHPKLRGRNIRYYYKEKPDQSKQVTVLFEDEFKGHIRKRWLSGDYSG